MIGIAVVIGTIAFLGLMFTDTGKHFVGMGKNLFLVDASKNPKLAEGGYLKAIEDAQEQYRLASDTLSQLTGTLVEIKTNYDKADSELSTIESKCEKLAKNNDIEGLSVLSQKRNLLLTKKETYCNRIIELKPLVEEAQNIHNKWENEVTNLKNRKELGLTELELSNSMTKLYAKMDTLRKDTMTDKFLDKIEDNISKNKRQAVGAQLTHNNKIETKEEKLNQKLLSAESDEYVQSLINKYKNN